ncbi:hypothetical protein JXM67_08795 [candidate division WOR-3 bacterium]|nr:hypothetical protein [candidate division WOR-3 bacterium]
MSKLKCDPVGQRRRMSKVILVVMLLASVAAADPFNTVTAHTLTRGTGYVGPNVPAWIGLEADDGVGFSPALWLGYGLLHRFDATLMVESSIFDEFTFGNAMLEGRYELVSTDFFILSPVFDIYLPLYKGGTVYVGPGVMASAGYSFVNLHADLFYAIDIDSLNASEFVILASPEIWIGENFSLYTEANLFYSYSWDKEGNQDTDVAFEIWPGLCWYPTEWLSLSAACGLPTDLTYVSPGVSAYMSF